MYNKKTINCVPYYNFILQAQKYSVHSLIFYFYDNDVLMNSGLDNMDECEFK